MSIAGVKVTGKPVKEFKGALVEVEKGFPAVAFKAATFAGGAIQETVFSMFRSGTSILARSFLPAKMIETSESGKVSAGAISNIVYAGIQYRGGTIVPRTAKALAIPISHEAKSTGTWPRDWPRKLSLMKRKGKPPLLIEAKQKRGRVHFLLKRSNTIKGKPYLDVANKVVEPKIAKLSKGSLETQIAKGIKDA